MTIATKFSGQGRAFTFDMLRIGEEEIAIEGRTILQFLEEMKERGWTLIRSRATAYPFGVLCEYDFQRSLASPQSASSVPVTQVTGDSA